MRAEPGSSRPHLLHPQERMAEHGCRTPKLWAQCLRLSQAPGLSSLCHVVPGASSTGNGQGPAWTAAHEGPAHQQKVDREGRVRKGASSLTPLPLNFLPQKKFRELQTQHPNIFKVSGPCAPLQNSFVFKGWNGEGEGHRKGQREAHFQVGVS